MLRGLSTFILGNTHTQLVAGIIGDCVTAVTATVRVLLTVEEAARIDAVVGTQRTPLVLAAVGIGVT